MDMQNMTLTIRFPSHKSEKTADKYNDGFHAYQAVKSVLKVVGHPEGHEKPSVGVLWFCKTNRGDVFIKDALELCGDSTSNGIDGLLIVTADDIEQDEVPFRESPIICAHKDRVRCCKADLGEICKAVSKLKSSVVTDNTFQRKLAQVVANFAVFQPIGVAVGHGAPNDVSNRILAPIRLLAKLTAKDAASDITALWAAGNVASSGGKSCWNNFGEALKGGSGNDLTTELRSELHDVKEAFEKALAGVTDGPDAVAASAEALMTLMTEYRRNAGIVTEVEPATGNQEPTTQLDAVGKRKPLPKDGAYQLLVVDDHWKDWKPVLDRITAGIGVPIEINYSGDGRVACAVKIDTGPFILDQATAIPIVAAVFQADAVLLDIMINGVSGLDVLKQIREYSESIPVILWTTTRSQEITNRAQQANGVILKKTCEAKAFQDTLAYWLNVGRNRRGVSLLNPFFDSVIKRPEYRQYACDVAEWALKWMDGFSGMNSTFRVFTNHGGRHYTKVLKYIEHAIQSLLGKEDAYGSFFAADAEVREEEFLCLYVSVFLHEIGMFPIKTDGERILESAKYVHLVRTLHAPRGMLLLEGKNDELWLSEEGRERVQGCDRTLHGIDTIRAKCAVLVGYHARFLNFTEDNRSVFLSTDKGWYNPDRFKAMTESTEIGMFYRERAGKESDSAADKLISGCVTRLGNQFQKQDRLRLLRMSAVLRLCDAIDKGQSRNPPVYLSKSCPFILSRAQQERETLKQMVCEDMWVDRNGSVNCHMLTAAPDKKLLNAVLAVFENDSQTKKVSLSVADQAEIDAPWDSTRCIKSAAWLKFLQLWLDYVWMNEIGGVRKEDEDAVKRAMKVLEVRRCVSGTGKLNRKGVDAIIRITALFSIVEVLDEYKAIHEADLEMHIPLGASDKMWAKCTIHKRKVNEVWRGLQQARRGRRDSIIA